MSDLEELKQTFKNLGLKDFEVIEKSTVQEKQGVKWNAVIHVDQGMGYTDFYCNFYFLDGDFKGHGVWE